MLGLLRSPTGVIAGLGSAAILAGAIVSCQGTVLSSASGSGAGGAPSHASTSITTTVAASTSSTTAGTTTSSSAASTGAASSNSTTSSTGGTACISPCGTDADCQSTCPPQPGGPACCDTEAQMCFHAATSTCPPPPTTTSTSSGTGGGPGCTLATSYVDIDGDGPPQVFGSACAPTAGMTLEVLATAWVLDTCTQGSQNPLTIQYENMALMGAPPPWTSVPAQFDYVKGGVHWTGTGSLTVPTYQCVLFAPPPPPPYFFSGTFTATVAPPSAEAGAPLTISGSFCVPATCLSTLPG